MAEHVVPKKINVLIWAALLVLLALTCGISYVHMGVANAAVAMLIALAKAALVVLFFMEVWYRPRMIKALVIAGLFWLGIMFVMTFHDYLTRHWLTFPLQHA